MDLTQRDVVDKKGKELRVEVRRGIVGSFDGLSKWALTWRYKGIIINEHGVDTLMLLQ
jgi:hypothetical protein